MIFETKHLKRDLARHSVRGGAITLGAQAAKFGLRMATLCVLARALSPDEFGMLAMVSVFTGFLLLVQDLGLSSATVQREEVTTERASALFWVGVLAACGAALVCLLVAPGLAWFYGDPRLGAITRVLAAGFLLTGLGSQHVALLTRQMRFRDLAIIELVALALGSVAAIVAAARGAGYWSLVVMQLCLPGLTTAGAWLACRWRPGRPRVDSVMRSMLAFGGNLTGFRVVNFVARNVDDLLLGRFAGAAALGLYSRAYKLVLLPVQEITGPATSVVVPTLSRLQDDPERFRAYYLRAVQLVVSFGMPAVAVLFVLADEIVLLLLGPGWAEAVPLFRILAPAAFVGTFNTAGSWVCTAQGRTARMLRWQVVATAVTVAAFAVSIPWGAAGIAAAFSATAVGLRYPALLYLLRGSPVRAGDVLGVVWRPALAAIAAAAALLPLRGRMPASDLPLGGLAILLACFAGLYLAAWVALHASHMASASWRSARTS